MDPAASFPNALSLGAALALPVGLLAYFRRWLTLPAAALAVVIGTAIFATGMTLTLALLFFFFSARLLERSARSSEHAEELSAQKSSARTFDQVLSVGAVPAISAVGMLASGEAAFGVAALAALSFATADTWATAIGMTAARPPRLLGFGREVQAGFSGGVTLRGSVASVLGAVSVGLFAVALSGEGNYGPLLSVAGLGLAFAFVDSLLGATVQSRYRCAVCGTATENRRHCGRPTDRLRGYLSNPGVNLVCSLGAALVACWFHQ